MSLFDWVRRDGLLHAESCALIVMVVCVIAPVWLGALVAVLAGVVKELWDKEHGGVANWHDIVCDLVGVVAGTLLVLVWNKVRFG